MSLKAYQTRCKLTTGALKKHFDHLIAVDFFHLQLSLHFLCLAFILSLSFGKHGHITKDYNTIVVIMFHTPTITNIF